MTAEAIFRKLLIERRKKKKMTTTRLGEKVGLHNSSISRLELGQKRPYLDEAFKIAKVLGFKVRVG